MHKDSPTCTELPTCTLGLTARLTLPSRAEAALLHLSLCAPSVPSALCALRMVHRMSCFWRKHIGLQLIALCPRCACQRAFLKTELNDQPPHGSLLILLADHDVHRPRRSWKLAWRS